MYTYEQRMTAVKLYIKFQYEQEAQKFYRMLVERMKKFYSYVKYELWRTKRRRDQSCWMTWGKFKEILRIYPHRLAQSVPYQRLLKKCEFPIEEPIALIGHDVFCEGL